MRIYCKVNIFVQLIIITIKRVLLINHARILIDGTLLVTSLTVTEVLSDIHIFMNILFSRDFSVISNIISNQRFHEFWKILEIETAREKGEVIRENKESPGLRYCEPSLKALFILWNKDQIKT